MNKVEPTVVLSAICLLIVIGCQPTKKERPSPLRSDISTLNDSELKIEYSSPAVRDRKIWGELVPYGEIWRTGANDATVLSSSLPFKINGTQLDSGRYALFTIPDTTEWTIMLNQNWNQWGTYHYDSSLNVLELKLTPRKTSEFSERMTFSIQDDSLKFHWENLAFSLSLE